MNSKATALALPLPLSLCPRPPSRRCSHTWAQLRAEDWLGPHQALYQGVGLLNSYRPRSLLSTVGFQRIVASNRTHWTHPSYQSYQSYQTMLLSRPPTCFRKPFVSFVFQRLWHWGSSVFPLFSTSPKKLLSDSVVSDSFAFTKCWTYVRYVRVRAAQKDQSERITNLLRFFKSQRFSTTTTAKTISFFWHFHQAERRAHATWLCSKVLLYFFG